MNYYRFQIIHGASWFILYSVDIELAKREGGIFEQCSMEFRQYLSCVQVLLALHYTVEYRKLDFRNPGPVAFWLLEFVAYLVLSYSASLNLALQVECF